MAGISEPTSASSARHELDLVAEAIALVAAGRSARVVLASLHHGNDLLEPARELAGPAGVRIVPLETHGGLAVDIAVERIADV